LKAEKLIIETPEKIIFTYNIAEIGTRIAAYLIDSLLQLLILLILFLVLGLSFISSDAYGEDQAFFYMAIIYILLFLFQWGYFVFFETVLNGKTPGKQACHIRVIRSDGTRLDFQSLVVRNLLRAADSIPLPFFNLLGGLIAIIHKQNKRLGDLAAGTIVVTDSLFYVIEPSFQTNISDKNMKLFARPLEKSRLNEKDLYILRRLLNDRNKMSPEIGERTAGVIVEKLKAKYDLSEVLDKSNFEIIEEIYKAHTYENEK
jgi:uncharacterized RDD family membrane protein YckC